MSLPEPSRSPRVFDWAKETRTVELDVYTSLVPLAPPRKQEVTTVGGLVVSVPKSVAPSVRQADWAGASRSVSIDRFMHPTVALERRMPIALPSIHKILGPLYILLAMFGIVTAVILSAATVTPYHFIAGSGPLLTVIAAIVYLWTVYKKVAK